MPSSRSMGDRGVEHHPVPVVDAQAERLVALEHGDGTRVEPRGQHGAHLAATEGERLLQTLLVYPLSAPETKPNF